MQYKSITKFTLNKSFKPNVLCTLRKIFDAVIKQSNKIRENLTGNIFLH